MKKLEDLVREDVKIVMDDKYIIKVKTENKKYFYGFDIITEDFKRVPRETSLEMPKYMLDFLNNESIRARLALSMCSSYTKASRLLRLSERTLFRLIERMNKE